MKKWIKYSLIGIIILIIGIISMFVFKLCPPEGPWPSPPWCVKVIPFEAKDLDYLPKTLEPTTKNLEFGIGTYDVWGNMHKFIDLGEETRNNYKPTIERIAKINSELYLITDVVTLGENGTLIYTTKNEATGMISITEDYLVKIGNLLREAGINNFMYLTNINDNTDEIEDYLSRDLSPIQRAIGETLKDSTRTDVGYEPGKILDDYDEEGWNLMFGRWREVMIIQAEKAEKAGVTHFVITPGDTGFNWRLENKLDYQKQKYGEIVEEIRKVYSGKIGVHGRLDEMEKMNWDFVDFSVITINSHSDYILQEIFKNKEYNVKSLEQGFNEYFARSEWDSLNKENYLLIIIPSVNMGLKVGWIPLREIFDYSPNQQDQAIGYEALFQSIYSQNTNVGGIISYGYWWNDRLFPETKVLRNDNDYTIRTKDAEQVYYKWSNVFS